MSSDLIKRKKETVGLNDHQIVFLVCCSVMVPPQSEFVCRYDSIEMTSKWTNKKTFSLASSFAETLLLECKQESTSREGMSSMLGSPFRACGAAKNLFIWHEPTRKSKTFLSFVSIAQNKDFQKPGLILLQKKRTKLLTLISLTTFANHCSKPKSQNFGKTLAKFLFPDQIELWTCVKLQPSPPPADCIFPSRVP